MIKSWLIKTEAPFVGTEQYYRAYSKINPLEIDEVNAWFWEEETMNLWDSYGFRWEDEFEDEYEEVKDDFAEKIIKNGIDCNRFFPKNPINNQLTSVLSLCQSSEANKIIKEACLTLGIHFEKANKYEEAQSSFE